MLIPTPPIPVTPPTSRAALHEGDTPAPVSTEPVFSFNISSPLSHPAATLDDITPHDAEAYGDTQLARLHDNHSLYFSSVINAIASFLFCQDQLIANDWDVNSYRDDTYPGHPVVAGDPKLPTGGPRSTRDWSDRVEELRDHRAHTCHLLKLVDTILSPRMLTEASTMSSILSCDKQDHIKGQISPSFFVGKYSDVNPFFSSSEARRLNAYIAVARFHDIVGELTTSHILDTGTYDEIISAARDLDHVLKITRSSLVVLKTSPFRTEYIDAPKRKVTTGRKVRNGHKFFL